jgi:hypothetical protein
VELKVMDGQQSVRVLAARRADAGTVRLGQCDITGLVLCAEHYGVPYDLLAAALDVRPDRLRGIVARWRRAGYVTTGTLGPGPTGQMAGTSPAVPPPPAHTPSSARHGDAQRHTPTWPPHGHTSPPGGRAAPVLARACSARPPSVTGLLTDTRADHNTTPAPQPDTTVALQDHLAI